MKIKLKSLSARLIAGLLFLHPLAGYAFNPSSDSVSPPVNTPFTTAVANVPIIEDFVFGSSASAPTDCVSGGICQAITNATQLASYFNPVEANTGTIKVNSELESYSTSFTTGNHIFNTNNLQLTGALGSGGSAAPTVYGNVGSYFGSTYSFTTGN